MQSYALLAVVTAIVFILVQIPFGYLFLLGGLGNAPHGYSRLIETLYVLMYIIGIPLSAYLISINSPRLRFWKILLVLIMVPASIATVYISIMKLSLWREKIAYQQADVKRKEVMIQLEQAQFTFPRYNLEEVEGDYFFTAIIPSNMNMNYYPQLLQEVFLGELDGIAPSDFGRGVSIGNCRTGNYRLLPNPNESNTITIEWNFYGKNCSENDLNRLIGTDITIKNRRTGAVIQKFPINQLY